MDYPRTPANVTQNYVKTNHKYHDTYSKLHERRQ